MALISLVEPIMAALQAEGIPFRHVSVSRDGVVSLLFRTEATAAQKVRAAALAEDPPPMALAPSLEERVAALEVWRSERDK